MSRPRYKWWSYVKWMVRQYPERAAREKRADDPPQGTEIRETEAVAKAVAETRGMETGRERLRIIELVYWKNRCTLQGACDAVHVAYDTGKVYHAEFIRCVARHFGLL